MRKYTTHLCYRPSCRKLPNATSNLEIIQLLQYSFETIVLLRQERARCRHFWVFHEIRAGALRCVLAPQRETVDQRFLQLVRDGAEKVVVNDAGDVVYHALQAYLFSRQGNLGDSETYLVTDVEVRRRFGHDDQLFLVLVRAVQSRQCVFVRRVSQPRKEAL